MKTFREYLSEARRPKVKPLSDAQHIEMTKKLKAVKSKKDKVTFKEEGGKVIEFNYVVDKKNSIRFNLKDDYTTFYAEGLFANDFPYLQTVSMGEKMLKQKGHDETLSRFVDRIIQSIEANKTAD